MIGSGITVLLLITLVGVLLAGVILMGVGGKANARYSNRLMVARVALQALVLVMVALLFFAGKQ